MKKITKQELREFIKNLASRGINLSSEQSIKLEESINENRNRPQLIKEQGDAMGDVFQLWGVNKTTGDCGLTLPIEPFYICQTPNQIELAIGGSDAFDVFLGAEEININTTAGVCCSPDYLTDGAANTFNNFMQWINNECVNDELVGLSDGAAGTNIGANDPVNELFNEEYWGEYYITTECPSCLPDLLPGAPYTLGDNWQAGNLNVVDGNNWIPPNNTTETVLGGLANNPHLSQILDDSCVIATCTQPYYDNYFCNDGIHGNDLCTAGGVLGNATSQENGSTYNAGSAGEIVQWQENNSCQYSGCIGAYGADNYICNEFDGALCPGATEVYNIGADNGFAFDYNAGTTGQFNNNATPNQGIAGGYDISGWEGFEDFNFYGGGMFIQTAEGGNGCTITYGCTNPIFTSTYNADANMDDGSCVWQGCANPKFGFLTDVYVCSITDLCDGDGLGVNGADDYVQTYYEGINTGLFWDAGPALVQNDNIVCPEVAGCTNPLFDNYSSENTLEAETPANGVQCVVGGCLDSAAANYLCRTKPGLCVGGWEELPQSAHFRQNYSGIAAYSGPDTIIEPFEDATDGIPYFIIGCENNECCGDFGCTDDGTGNGGPNYAGQGSGTSWLVDVWLEFYSGQSLQGVTLPTDHPSTWEQAIPYEDIQASNYCADCIEDDGSCQYDSNGNLVPDWDDVGGCYNNGIAYDESGTSLFLNTTFGANFDDGSCIPVVFGCTDDGTKDQNWWQGITDPYLGTVYQGGQGAGWEPLYPNNFDYSTKGAGYDVNYHAVPPCTEDMEEGTACVSNYNPDANVDDGSCEYNNIVLEGCMDVNAPLYDPTANVDNSVNAGFANQYDYENNPCGYYYGCTEQYFTLNYAGSELDGWLTPVGNAWDPYVVDYGCQYDNPGCMETSAENYGEPLYPELHPETTPISSEGGNCYWTGCTQPMADNFTIITTISSTDVYGDSVPLLNDNSITGNTGYIAAGPHTDNGSCLFNTLGQYCLDPNDADQFICDNTDLNMLCDQDTFSNINTDIGTWNMENSNCTDDPVLGCKDPNALNTCEDCDNDDPNVAGGTYCRYEICLSDVDLPGNVTAINEGIIAGTGINGENLITTHPEGSDVEYVFYDPTEYNMPSYDYKCADCESATNFGGSLWSTGTSPDGYDNQTISDSCKYEGCPSSTGVPETYLSTYPGQYIDLEAVDGTPLYGYHSQNYGCQTDPDDQESVVEGNTSCCYRQGCTDSLANNYEEYYTVSSTTGGNAPEGSEFYNNGCSYTLGCTDDTQNNFNPEATLNDGSCYALGCPDAEADNYWCDGTTTIYGFEGEQDDYEIDNDCDPSVPDYVSCTGDGDTLDFSCTLHEGIDYLIEEYE